MVNALGMVAKLGEVSSQLKVQVQAQLFPQLEVARGRVVIHFQYVVIKQTTT